MVHLTGSEIIRTARGGPGTPIADIVFHLIMYDSMNELDTWIKAQCEYQQLQADLNIDFTTIVWADDVAVPWMTHQADQLLPALEALLMQVHRIFTQRGLPLNYAVGKTNAVLTFRGPKAPELRQQHQLCPNPGMQVQVTQHEEVFLPFVPRYTHLGAMYTAAQTLDVEIRHRSGEARSAFQKIAKPILCNRHLPEHLRVRLFGSLTGTKLFHGLGSWTTPPQTLKQHKQLTKAYVGLLRKVLRLGTQGFQCTNAQVLERAGLPTARVRLACERLLYAQRIFQVGPVFLQTAIHAEHAICEASWLHGPQADLTMQTTCLLPLPQGIPQTDQKLWRYPYLNFGRRTRSSGGAWSNKLLVAINNKNMPCRECMTYTSTSSECLAMQVQSWNPTLWKVKGPKLTTGVIVAVAPPLHKG